jgi:UPF0042 nucleotide-binding protein
MPDKDPVATNTSPLQMVLITGMSGSGKGTVLKSLEDVGFYAVDNLPADLLLTFARLIKDSPQINKAAIVVDVRGERHLERLPVLVEELREQLRCTLVYMESDDATIVRRYSETRRPHPLHPDRSVSESVQAERDLLQPIREKAEHIIDTSKFNVHELREYVQKKFANSQAQVPLRIALKSFGFKHGVPTDSDLVFDVRFLPNPNYIPEFRHLTGRHEEVAAYVAGFPQTKEFIERISALLKYLIPHYIEEGKSYLTVSFGCTGGHHRSVMIAEEIARRLEAAGYAPKLMHRDTEKQL